MNLWIKRALLALGALLLLAALAAVYFVATFDATHYKSIAIDWMKTERQRTLAIDGPVDLSVFPRLAVKVSKLHLSERGRADEFASIDEAALSLQWLPLLRKQLVVDSVSARGVRALITRDAQGLRNIDDLLGVEEATALRPRTKARGRPMRFEVGAVRLEDARLALRDEQAQITGTVTMDSFTSGRLASGQETPVQFRTTVTLERPQVLRLTFDGKTALTFDAASGSASAARRHGQDRRRRRSREVAACHAGRQPGLGRQHADRRADRPQPQRCQDRRHDAGPVDADRAAPGLQPEHAKARARGVEAGACRASRARAASALRSSGRNWRSPASSCKGSGFSGRFNLDGKTTLAGRFESGAPSGNFDALRLPAFALKLDGSSGPRKIDGQLKSNLLLRPGRSAATLERLELRANITEPGLQPLALDARRQCRHRRARRAVGAARRAQQQQVRHPTAARPSTPPCPPCRPMRVSTGSI